MLTSLLLEAGKCYCIHGLCCIGHNRLNTTEDRNNGIKDNLDILASTAFF